MEVSKEILTGKTGAHVQLLEGTPYQVHKEVIAPLRALQKRAKEGGIDLRVASAFRDYPAQLRIWNQKATGKRALLDVAGRPLDFARLSPEQIVTSILRWSAVPGASRHHWGTDLDVYDHAALPGGYQLQLLPQEAEPGGCQEAFDRWLEKNLAAEGFFRPYARDLGGVSPEWWHISYAPLAGPYYQAYRLDLFEQVVREAELEQKDAVLARLAEIYHLYVRNITPP